MKVKKFMGTSMQDVMNKIRAEFGQEAVILNSKVVTSNGFLGLFKKKTTFEVVAAMDDDSLGRNKMTFTKVVDEKDSPIKWNFSDSPIRFDKAAKEGTDPSQEILNELQAMKKWLFIERKYSLFPDSLKEIHQELIEMEFNDEIREKLMNHLVENWRHHRRSTELSKAELSELIHAYLLKQVQSLAVQEKKVFKKKYINVLGPTGVGKTTTIAKIAAEYVMNYQKQIAFITTDTYRIAAIEQLKTYAEILRIPVEVAYNHEDFKLAVKRFAHYDHVFIDTAGRNYRNGEFVDDLKELIDFDMDMETYLVLSSTSKQCDMDAIYHQFSIIPLQGVIFTKVDETGFRGSVINFMVKHQVPIIYMTNGQDVPDDIMLATPERIVETVCGGHFYA